MDNKKHEIELLLHMVFGTLIFGALAAAAMALDLAAQWATTTGISSFTSSALSGAAHILLVVDLVLFAAYIAKTSWLLMKEMYK